MVSEGLKDEGSYLCMGGGGEKGEQGGEAACLGQMPARTGVKGFGFVRICEAHPFVAVVEDVRAVGRGDHLVSMAAVF